MWIVEWELEEVASTKLPDWAIPIQIASWMGYSFLINNVGAMKKSQMLINNVLDKHIFTASLGFSFIFNSTNTRHRGSINFDEQHSPHLWLLHGTRHCYFVHPCFSGSSLLSPSPPYSLLYMSFAHSLHFFPFLFLRKDWELLFVFLFLFISQFSLVFVCLASCELQVLAK